MILSSDLWVYALIRRAQLAGAYATVLRRGDARGGAVLVKTVNRKTGDAKLYAQAVGGQGETLWMQPLSGAEADLEAYLERAAGRDPDIWVVEIEDADGARFLTQG